MSIQETLKQKTWAIVGATPNTQKYGYKVMKKLIETGHKVVPINPKYSFIESYETYPRLSDYDGKIDVVMLIVNPTMGIVALEECISLGIQTVWIQPGAESDLITKTAMLANIELIHSCILTY